MTATPPAAALPFLDHWADPPTTLPLWVTSLRRAGLARYQALGGTPTPKVEAWKYTNLKPLAMRSYRRAEGAGRETAAVASLPTESLLSVAGPRLVLVNGRLSPALSSPLNDLPDGLTVEPLAEALLNDSSGLEGLLLSPGNAPAMAALNTAWLEDGLVVRYEGGLAIDQPLHVVLVSAPQADAFPILTHPCLVVMAEGGSRATLIESHIGLGPSLVNMVGLVHVEAGAAFAHVLAQSGACETDVIGFTAVEVAKDGLYQRFTLTTGLGLVRNELLVTLGGTGAACRLHGAYTADGNRHVDNTIVVDHTAPATTSRQMFKGVLDGNGRGVFQGCIGVRPAAQKSDGYQLHKALLLSPQAEVDCKPELEIYADDVRCSHGATAGALDEDALFYLRARGLDVDTARALLIEAFLDDVIDAVAADLPGLSEAARIMVSAWLASRMAPHQLKGDSVLAGNGQERPE